jgi:hypothetical protein
VHSRAKRHRLTHFACLVPRADEVIEWCPPICLRTLLHRSMAARAWYKERAQTILRLAEQPLGTNPARRTTREAAAKAPELAGARD